MGRVKGCRLRGLAPFRGLAFQLPWGENMHSGVSVGVLHEEETRWDSQMLCTGARPV